LRASYDSVPDAENYKKMVAPIYHHDVSGVLGSQSIENRFNVNGLCGNGCAASTLPKPHRRHF
jgi:hypothetical protein